VKWLCWKCIGSFPFFVQFQNIFDELKKKGWKEMERKKKRTKQRTVSVNVVFSSIFPATKRERERDRNTNSLSLISSQQQSRIALEELFIKQCLDVDKHLIGAFCCVDVEHSSLLFVVFHYRHGLLVERDEPLPNRLCVVVRPS